MMTESPSSVNFICVWTGTAFPFQYVTKLHNAITRNTTFPFHFWVVTDNPEAKGYINISHLVLPKWWGKIALFDPTLRPKGHCFYFDLDTVIVGNIDEMVSRGTQQQHDFLILENFLQPPVRSDRAPKDKFGSAVMYFAPGWGSFVWDAFMQDPEGNMAKHERSGDQGFIESVVPDTICCYWQHILPADYFRSVKYPESLLYRDPPDETRVMCFHGMPRPHNVTDLGWVKEHWR